MQSTQKRSRPGWVWAIAIWFGVGALITLLSLSLAASGAIHMNAAQSAYFAGLTATDYAMSILIGSLNLVGAIFIALLRRAALYLFCISLVLNVLMTIWHTVAKGFIAAFGDSAVVGMILAIGLLCAVCLYSRRLIDRGILV